MPQQSEQFAEDVMMKNSLVTVTSTRVITGGTTYPVNSITAVTGIKHPASYTLPIFLILGGSILTLATFFVESYFFTFLGVVLSVLGIWLFCRLKPVYSVTVSMAGGQSDILASYDWGFISSVIEAINQAIIRRG